MLKDNGSAGVLAAGGIAAILASACCLGPLVLVSLGLGGAWIGNLTALEPFRPVFVGAALVALFFAYRRIFRPAAECRPAKSVRDRRRSAPIRSFLGSWPPWWWSRSPSPTSSHGFTKRISR